MKCICYHTDSDNCLQYRDVTWTVL